MNTWTDFVCIRNRVCKMLSPKFVEELSWKMVWPKFYFFITNSAVLQPSLRNYVICMTYAWQTRMQLGEPRKKTIFSSTNVFGIMFFQGFPHPWIMHFDLCCFQRIKLAYEALMNVFTKLLMMFGHSKMQYLESFAIKHCCVVAYQKRKGTNLPFLKSRSRF